MIRGYKKNSNFCVREPRREEERHKDKPPGTQERRTADASSTLPGRNKEVVDSGCPLLVGSLCLAWRNREVVDS